MRIQAKASACCKRRFAVLKSCPKTPKKMIRGENCEPWKGMTPRHMNLVVSDLKPVLRRVKGAVLVANLTRPGIAGVSVRVIGNWLGLEFASKMPNTGTRTGEGIFLQYFYAISQTWQTDLIIEHAVGTAD